MVTTAKKMELATLNKHEEKLLDLAHACLIGNVPAPLAIHKGNNNWELHGTYTENVADFK